jgi:uncharacterized coiled-coil DUF342 family protein
MSSKDDYIKMMHSKLNQWNAEIDALAAKADQAEAQARTQYHQQIQQLRSKKIDAGEQLETLQKSGEHAWEDLKSGLDKTWNTLGEAISSVKSNFK